MRSNPWFNFRIVFLAVFAVCCPRESLFCSSLSDPTINLEIILDASGSMNGQAAGMKKITIAEDVVKRFAERLYGRSDLNLGLRVYGHQSPKSEHDCFDSRLESPLRGVEKDSIIQVLERVEAKGYTPIAYSLEEALKDFPAVSPCVNVIILITDGVESCGGDPCAAARKLQNSDKQITVHVIGFLLNEKGNKTIQCIPQASGGFYYDACSATSLEKAFKDALDVSLHGGYVYINSTDYIENCKIMDQRTGGFLKRCCSRTNVNLLPGLYKIEIPSDPPIIKENVLVRKNEKTVVEMKGFGRIKIETRDYIAGCRIIDEKSGEVFKTVYSNVKIKVPAGTYRVEIPSEPPELIENVSIETGEYKIVKPVAKGYLYIQTRSIVEGCRIYRKEDGKLVMTAYSKVTLDLPAGEYRVEVPAEPAPVERTVVIEGGKKQILRISR